MTTPRQRLEECLRTRSLAFFPERSPMWEHALLPNMVAICWSLAQEDAAPEQMAFAHEVAARLGSSDDGITARACRTYPALVRKHHFGLVLQEHFPLVVWATVLDQSGVDLLVIEDGRAYGLALSVDTPAAHRWQEVKAHRHPGQPSHLPVYKLDVRPDEYAVGPFWLHPPEQWQEVRHWIESERAWGTG